MHRKGVDNMSKISELVEQLEYQVAKGGEVAEHTKLIYLLIALDEIVKSLDAVTDAIKGEY